MAIGYLSQDQSIYDFLDKKWSITVLFITIMFPFLFKIVATSSFAK